MAKPTDVYALTSSEVMLVAHLLEWYEELAADRGIAVSDLTQRERDVIAAFKTDAARLCGKAVRRG